MSGLHSLLPFTLYKHQSHFVFCFKGSNYLSCNLLVTVQCRNNSRAVYFSHFSVQAKQSDLTCCCLNSYMQLVNITAILACQFITLQKTHCYISLCSSTSKSNCATLALAWLPLKSFSLQFLWYRKFEAHQSSLACIRFSSKYKTHNLLVRF